MEISFLVNNYIFKVDNNNSSLGTFAKFADKQFGYMASAYEKHRRVIIVRLCSLEVLGMRLCVRLSTEDA